MKIALVCPYNIGRGGGVFEIIKDLRSGLVSRGHYVQILTPLPRDPVANTEDIIFLGGGTEIRSPTHTSMQFSVGVDTDAIDEVLKKERFDIIHFHEPEVPILSRQILSRSSAVNIATFHAVVPETLTSRSFIRVVMPYTQSILKYLDKMTAVSEAAAEYVRSLTKKEIEIIPNGIDLTRYYRSNKENPYNKQSRKKIVYIGRLERRKGVSYLLQAYALLQAKHENVELIIAGAGPDRERLELLAEDLKLRHVSFIGFIDEPTKLNLLQTADLFCSPAVYGESFGIVLLEAMATGAVTVAGNNSGYDSLMQGLGQVSIVDPHDSKEFARRMHLLLNEVKLRNLWEEWSSEYVKQFNYPTIISKYEDVYERALKEHKKN